MDRLVAQAVDLAVELYDGDADAAIEAAAMSFSVPAASVLAAARARCRARDVPLDEQVRLYRLVNPDGSPDTLSIDVDRFL
jgi:hypothetical protein